MLDQNNCASVYMPAAASTAAGKFACSWDTKGYDHAKAYVLLGTHATDGATVSEVSFSQSDTYTAATSQTDIVSLTCAAATSSTAGVALPAVADLGKGGVLEFSINLKNKKRYMGLYIATGTTTMTVGALVVMSKSEVSKDSATYKTVTNKANTNANGCALFVEG